MQHIRSWILYVSQEESMNHLKYYNRLQIVVEKHLVAGLGSKGIWRTGASVRVRGG